MDPKSVDSVLSLVGGVIAGAGITAFLGTAGLTVGGSLLGVSLLPVVLVGTVVGLVVCGTSQDPDKRG